MVTYHPALNKSLPDILKNNQFLLQGDPEHLKCFDQSPRIAYRRPKNLKDILVTAKLPPLSQENGCFADCKGCRSDCKVGPHFLNSATTFSTITIDKTYDIRCGPLRCNSIRTVYLLTCKTCQAPYIGKAQNKFRERVNLYRSKFRIFQQRGHDESRTLTPQEIGQRKFNEHFAQPDHHGEEDWHFILIDQARTNAQLCQKELFWQYKLNVFEPNGLNIRAGRT